MPNVLIFCVDEMRADHMGCVGNTIVKTPNIDRIAARGTLFDRGYCNNPICMPARASMFTGLLPRDHGTRINGQSLRRDLPVLPEILRQAGYSTRAAGKLHLTAIRPMLTPHDIVNYPECIDAWNDGAITEFPTPYFGFEEVAFVGGHTSYAFGPYIAWLEARGGSRAMLGQGKALAPPRYADDCYKMGMPEELHYNRYIADATIDRIRRSAQTPGKPFFAWCSFPDPHVPVAPPAPYADMYDPDVIPLPPCRKSLDDLPPFYTDIFEGRLKPNGYENRPPDDARVREMIALTYGMITHLDHEIGRVLDALEAAGMTEDTLILFTSDHGDMMGDHGLLWKAFYTFRGCINVPFIVAAPGMPGGRRSSALVSQIDMLPSILDICGLPMPGAEWADRQTPFERGKLMPLQIYPGRSWRGLLDGSVATIRESVVIENDDPTTGLQVRCLVTPQYRLSIYPGTEDGELFDVLQDSDELHNLWYQPGQRGLRDRLVAQLLDAYTQHQPMGPIPPWNS